MPIQYYDADWFKNRPPHARAKLAAKLIVAFVPGSSDFFSRRTDNEAGGDKAGGNSGAAPSDATTDDSGESVGTQNSDDEQSVDANESVGSFITDDEGVGEDEEGFESGSDGEDEDVESSDVDDEHGDGNGDGGHNDGGDNSAAFECDVETVHLRTAVTYLTDSRDAMNTTQTTNTHTPHNQYTVPMI
ncbi:hypothetical protein DFH09DRAFT_1301744 [Mycena vulgaris]|nr:hypothetical protein DFH09DRAFT_1301744 [Mycena vulgaris]